MNLSTVALVLLFVLTMGAALVDLVWHCAPMRGKWPFPQGRHGRSRLQKAENTRRVLFAQVRRGVSKQ